MSGIGEENRQTQYDDTMEALRRAESALPDFSSSYDGQIRALYEQIVNRPAFRYDPGSDPLYQSYRTQLTEEGSRAMRDTMGQAAALTGGYGSSYAQAVGQEQYGLYLRRLGQVMPQLYQAAWERYSAEGDELYRRFGAALDLAQDEAGRAQERYEQALRLEQQNYDREQDRLDREAQLEQRSYEREQQLEQRAYDREQDRLNREAQQDKQSYEWAEKSYQKLVTLITESGYSPSDAELQAAGMSRAQAEALRRSYLMNNPMAALSGLTGSSLLSAMMGGYAGTGGSYSAAYGGTRSTGGSAAYSRSSSAAPYAGIAKSAASSAVTAAASKEQVKLAANQQGSNTKGKQRRL